MSDPWPAHGVWDMEEPVSEIPIQLRNGSSYDLDDDSRIMIVFWEFLLPLHCNFLWSSGWHWWHWIICSIKSLCDINCHGWPQFGRGGGGGEAKQLVVQKTLLTMLRESILVRFSPIKCMECQQKGQKWQHLGSVPSGEHWLSSWE